MRVVVTGGRDYADRQRLFGALDALHARLPITLLIHGGAQGADHLAWVWARERGIPDEVYFADWNLGRKAGPLRNQRMLDEGKPDRVVIFRGGKGTDDMTRRALRAKVRCLFVDPRSSTLPTGSNDDR